MKTVARFFRWLADKIDPPVTPNIGGGGGPSPIKPD
jgi:hypothetical protein